MLPLFIIKKIVGFLIRHGITGAGLLLVNAGYADENTVQELTGAAVIVSGLVFSMLDKKAAIAQKKEEISKLKAMRSPF